jgi:hypothetical protein
MSRHALKGEFRDPISGRLRCAQWRFREYQSGSSIVALASCDLSVEGNVFRGFGDGIFLKTALKKAFCEAWERFHWNASLEASTNGFAAGYSANAALAAAKNELLERALLSKAWSSRAGWVLISRRGLIDKLLTQHLEADGWRVRLFGVEQVGLGSLIAGLAQHTARGAVFDCSFVPRFDSARRSRVKVMLSLIRQSVVVNQEVDLQLGYEASPEDHRKFYASPENSRAFDFLDSADLQRLTLDPLNDVQLIESKIIFSVSGFPIVARATHPNWPSLAWGRQSISGVNPWPHPLA